MEPGERANKASSQRKANISLTMLQKKVMRISCSLLWDVLSNLSLAQPILSSSSVGEQGQPISHVNSVDLPHYIAG